MTDAESVPASVDSATSTFEQLGEAFIALEAHGSASENKVQWKEIEEYFQNLEKSLNKGFSDLKEKENAFVQKETESLALIAERESVVSSKEQALVDRVQEVKDTAVAAILEAWEKFKPASPEPVDVANDTDLKVSSSPNGDLSSSLPAPEESSPYRSSENAMAVDVQPRPELTQFCEQMDAKGLLNFIMENEKNIVDIRREIPLALKSASKPAQLVLDLLEGFYPLDQTTTNQGDSRDSSLQGMRRSCVMLMESVAPLLVVSEPDIDDPLNPETKQQAKTIADEWKPKLAEGGIDAANGNSLEAEAFLQLLATFRIATEFDEDELCKLVLAIARSRQAPGLCRSLGLTHKMPGVIEKLISSGRQIEAVHFVQFFKLTDNYSSVSLLKTHLKDLRRNSQAKIVSAGGAVGVQNESNAQELASLKGIIKCVEAYKLEAEYPLDPLQRRVAQLEKSKADKKRMGEVTKHHQPKRARANGGHYGSRMPISAMDIQQPPPVYADRGVYHGAAAERYYPHSVGGLTSTYDYHQMPIAAAAAAGSTAPVAGGGAATAVAGGGAAGGPPGVGGYVQQQHTIIRRPYYYSQEEKTTPASYTTDPTTYGSYAPNGIQPSHQPYM